MEVSKDRRTTLSATEDFRELYERLKNKGYNFAQISSNALAEAIQANMEVPKPIVSPRRFRKGSIYSVGVVIPAEIADELDRLTKPTSAKSEYVREAIRRYVDKYNLL